MTRDISKLSKTQYDVLVIGGGINGACIANLASAAGFKVALLEKDDWACGTSSKSTKLLHGGLRYLENLEFSLVAESLKERSIQWKAAPHLVKPLRFIVPVYKGHGRPLWMIKLGVWLYDVLSGPHSLGRHSHLSAEAVLKAAPSIKSDGLQGGVSYFDAQMDDSRLCLENVLQAVKQGADAFNYLKVEEFLKENGRCTGAQAKDRWTGQTLPVRARKIIVAAGPWSDRLRNKDNAKTAARLRPTKGVHLVCRGDPGTDAFLLQNPQDNRVFFAIPFKGNLLIGTTDTDYDGPPDQVQVEEDDVKYLLEQTRVYFPGLDLKAKDIITSFAGLRPLVRERGAPSKISRQHVVERDFSGVLYVMGGKYTTCRTIAADALAQAFPLQKLKFSDEKNYAVFGGGGTAADIKSLGLQYGMETRTMQYLASFYGSRFEDVLALVRLDLSLKAPICSCSPAIRAQVVYSRRWEMAVTVDDVYNRRLGLEYNACPTRQCRHTIEQMLAES